MGPGGCLVLPGLRDPGSKQTRRFDWFDQEWGRAGRRQPRFALPERLAGDASGAAYENQDVEPVSIGLILDWAPYHHRFRSEVLAIDGESAWAGVERRCGRDL